MDFDGLVDEYEQPIFSLIFRLVGDRDEAADLTQETFVAAYRSFPEFRGESSVYTWLYRIAINRCKNRYRERDKQRRFEAGSLDEMAQDEAFPGSREPASSAAASPDAALQRKELRERIEEAISRLPYDYRIVVVLRDLHGLSYQEIARTADLNIDVVRTRLARGRGMLRQKLSAYLAE